MTTETKPIAKNLAKKVLAVQTAVQSIPKRGKNNHFNYSYILSADAVEAIGKACVENGVTVTVSDVISVIESPDPRGRQKDQRLVDLTIAYRICDVETGENEVVRWHGFGIDGMDKGLYKAYTGAKKYFLMEYFMVAADDNDPENPKFPSSQQQKPGTDQVVGRQRQEEPPAPTEPTARKEHIEKLLANPLCPPTLAEKVRGWLDEDNRWADDAKSANAIAKLMPYVPGTNRGAAAPATAKQLELLGKLIARSDVDKAYAGRIDDALKDQNNRMSKGQASAAIDGCNWYTKQAKSDAAPGATDQRRQAEQKKQEEKDANEFDEEMAAQISELEHELNHVRIAPDKKHYTAVRDWLDDTAPKNPIDIESWLNAVKGWDLKSIQEGAK